MTLEERIALVLEELALTTDMFSEGVIENKFELADAKFSDDEEAANIQVKIFLLRVLRARAVKRTDYQQNETQEKKFQTFSGLGEMLEEAKQELREHLADAVNATGAAVHFAHLKRSPTRLKEYPNRGL